jgi:hypothetical protein
MQRIPALIHSRSPVLRTVSMTLSAMLLIFSFCNFAHIPVAGADPGHGTQEPFFVVNGGDTGTGSGFEDTGWPGHCDSLWYTVPVGGYNNNNAGGKGYYGAGVQDAGFTPDTLEDLATDLNSDAPLTDPYAYSYTYPAGTNQGTTPAFLGFANTNQNIGLDPTILPPPTYPYQYPVSPTQGRDGGDFGLLPCMTEFYTDAVTSTNPAPQTLTDANFPLAMNGNVLNLNALETDYDGGTYSYTGNLMITAPNPLTMPANKEPITIAVNGDAYIDSNITYSYNSLGTIPKLNIYTDTVAANRYYGASGPATNHGDIFVDNSVSTLHGFFVAQGSVADNVGIQATGNFITCGTSNPGDTTFSQTTLYATCSVKPLDVDGAVYADYFLLERSYGDVNNVNMSTSNTANAAEVFQYSPELWVPAVACTSTVAACINTNYASINSAPPVL